MSSFTVSAQVGDPNKPILVFIPALGTSPAVWTTVVGQLSSDFHCVLVALPGHPGATEKVSTPETISALARDLAELAQESGWQEFSLVGVSIGGAIAIETALLKPIGLAGIVVCCGSGRFGSEQAWLERAETVREAGTGSLIDFAARRWFAPGFAEKNPEPVGVILNDLLHTDDESYASLCKALAVWDRREQVSEIEVPSFVISGELDPASTSKEGAEISERMQMSKFVTLAGTSHLAPVEQPLKIAKLISGFQKSIPGATEDARARGYQTRREVLGDAHVDLAQAGTTPETLPFQEFITKYAWGEVWSREQLDRRSRSIATLAALVAIGNEHELPMHIRAAAKHGLSFEEIGEVFLQVGVYAGVPKANAAFQALKNEVAAEEGTQ